MKWFYRLFTFAILIVAVSAPFFIDNKQGEPMLSLPSADDILPGKAFLNDPSPATLRGDRTVYKWQDTQGSWHYGDTPPAEAKNISAITVNTNTNLIKSVPTKEESASPSGTLSNYEPPAEDDVLSFERAKNILKETKEVAAMMESRNQELSNIVGEQAKQ